MRTDMGDPKTRLSIDESISAGCDHRGTNSKGGLQFLDYIGAVVPW